MISRREVGQLLALAAAFDQRTVGTADVEAWHQIAQDHDWRLDTARQAITAHYGDRTERVMPAHITRYVQDPAVTGLRRCEY